jgi:probable rRNA maturation factor
MQPREIELCIDHPNLKGSEPEILQTISCIIESLGDAFPKGDVSIAILSDEKVAEIHGDFLDDPSETDVITFPGDPEMEFAGEVCVSADRAQATFKEQGTTFSEELTLYIAHGLLHLAGLNDKTEAQCVEMRKSEKQAMDLLKQEQKIPSFEFTSEPT